MHNKNKGYSILRQCSANAHASTRDHLIPYTVFIDPQLGRVGLSENKARKQGRNIRVAKLPMNAVSCAIETGETRGFIKAVVDAETQQILGCAILGAEGGEIMTIIQVAMMGKLPYTTLMGIHDVLTAKMFHAPRYRCIFTAPQLNTNQDGKLIEP